MEQTRSDAQIQVAAAHWQTFSDDRYIVWGQLPFWQPHEGRRQDEDNPWKPMIDELVKAGVFWDDHLIVQNDHQRVWVSDPSQMLATFVIWRFSVAGLTEAVPSLLFFDSWISERYNLVGRGE